MVRSGAPVPHWILQELSFLKRVIWLNVKQVFLSLEVFLCFVEVKFSWPLLSRHAQAVSTHLPISSLSLINRAPPFPVSRRPNEVMGSERRTTNQTGRDWWVFTGVWIFCVKTFVVCLFFWPRYLSRVSFSVFSKKFVLLLPGVEATWGGASVYVCVCVCETPVTGVVQCLNPQLETDGNWPPCPPAD